MDWGTVPDWVMAVTASVGVGFGLVQLAAIRRSEGEAVLQLEQQATAHRDRVQVERARLIMRLDEQFESAELKASRQALIAVRNRFEQEVEQQHSGASDKAKALEVAKRISAYVTKLWQDSRRADQGGGGEHKLQDKAAPEYFLLMHLPNWLETVGHLCRSELVSLGDVLILYDQVIVKCIGNFEEHIKARADQGPIRNPRHMENALWLFEEAKKHMEEKDGPRPSETVRSGLDWGRGQRPAARQS